MDDAGLAHYMPFAQLPTERARQLVDVNILAPVLLSRAVIPGMIARGRGAIINIASLLAFSGAARAPSLPQLAVYAATKAFLVTFGEILDIRRALPGIRVVARFQLPPARRRGVVGPMPAGLRAPPIKSRMGPHHSRS